MQQRLCTLDSAAFLRAGSIELSRRVGLCASCARTAIRIISPSPQVKGILDLGAYTLYRLVAKLS